MVGGVQEANFINKKFEANGGKPLDGDSSAAAASDSGTVDMER